MYFFLPPEDLNFMSREEGLMAFMNRHPKKFHVMFSEIMFKYNFHRGLCRFLPICAFLVILGMPLAMYMIFNICMTQ